MYGVGLAVNVPIYRKRLEAGVRQAEAEVIASARQFDARRDEALEQVRTLFVTARSQEQLLKLLDEQILPKTEQTYRVSLRGYEVGQVDFLQLVDNWRQLLQVRLNRQRLATQLQQTLASLERAVGGYRVTAGLERLPPIDSNAPIPEPVEELPKANP
jgi:outer membrane protein TolC